MWEFHEIHCRILDQSKSRFRHSGYHFCSDLARVLVNVLNERNINEGVSMYFDSTLSNAKNQWEYTVEVQGPK